MNKNIVIAILAILCVVLFFYGLIQNLEAKKQSEIAIAQAKIAMELVTRAQQKDKELARMNQQLQMALNEARIAREKEIRNLEKAQALYDLTVKQVEQAKKKQKK